MKIKKRLLIFFTFLMMVGMKKIPVFAAEDAIPSINIDVNLQKDGSAVITEVWEVQGVSSGTEYYKVLYNMDGMSVDSFQVWDESGKQYRTLDDWNTELTREEKAGTCGILSTADGYELCWGIGEYGDHTYTMQYTLNGLVKNYGDYAGFYHRFLSELSSAPESVLVKIRMEDISFDANSARIWGYGFPGSVSIETNGTLTAISSESLSSNEYVNILCRFSTDLFPLASSSDISFEELQESAEDKDFDVKILFGLLGVGVVILIFVYAFYGWYQLSDGTKVKLRSKNIVSNPSIPFGASLPAVSYSLELLRKKISYNELLSAYLIRWQREGYISIEERVLERKGKKEQKEKAIVFRFEVPIEQEIERKLYDILKEKADEEHILWSHSIEKNVEKLNDQFVKWEKEVQKRGKEELLEINAIAKVNKKEFCFTPAGFEHAIRVLGLKKYLKELTKLSKSPEKELWGEYLVFACIFNSGEKVLEIMKETDPVYFNTFAGYYGFNAYSMMYFMAMTNQISNKAVIINSDGSGGATSSFGGGGFSGGGGGGSR